VLFKPFFHGLIDPAAPAFPDWEGFHHKGVCRPQTATKVRPDLVCAPGRADEPDRGHGLDTILENLKGSDEGGLPVFVMRFVGNQVTGHGLFLSLR
jgi:hypothetical protein